MIDAVGVIVTVDVFVGEGVMVGVSDGTVVAVKVAVKLGVIVAVG